MSTFPELGLQTYYSCDALPEIPDNAAGTIEKITSGFDAVGEFMSDNAPLITYFSDHIHIAAGANNNLYRSNTYPANSKLYIKIKTTASQVNAFYWDGEAYAQTPAIPVTPNVITPLAFVFPNAATGRPYGIGTVGAEYTADIYSWYLGNGVYDTTLADDSGGGNNATVYSVCSISGKSGNGIACLNHTDRVVMTNPIGLGLDGYLTVSFWYKRHPFSTSYRTILGAYNADLHPLIIMAGGNNFSMWDGTLRSFPGSLAADDEYHHVAVIYSATNATLYYDGSFVGTITHSYNFAANGIGIIGNWLSATYPAGYIDEPRVYSRALTDAEVLIAYKEIVAKPNYGYLEREYEDTPYTATWGKAFSFSYIAGTTVVIAPTLTDAIPVGSSVRIYAGESMATLTEIFDGLDTGIVFTNSVSGTTNLYVRLVLFTSSRALNPIIASLNLVVKQSTSLWTLATQILSDALTDANVEWDVDLELQKYLIPYSWITQQTHREAIGQVAEAAGGVAYQDRYGIVRVEAGNFISQQELLTPLATINKDRILDLSSPISTVKNDIQIMTWPYVAGSNAQVWSLSSAKAINNGEVLSFDVKFNDFDAAINCSAAITSSPAGATITEETYYSDGAHIEVTGSFDEQSITALTVSGQPLTVVGSEVVIETDGSSIRRNGVKTLAILENKLIQSGTLAETIAEDIIATTANESRDISIDWRGDPTLELGDYVDVDGLTGIVVTQEFNFSGALTAKAQIRRA